MSATTEINTRRRLSSLLKTKIGKLHSANRIANLTSRSKSSPALLLNDSKPKSIPTCQTIIDLQKLKGEKEFNASIQSLIKRLFKKDWIKFSNGNDLKIERVSGALTNAIFFVSIGSKKMLLRVYGVGCDQVIDRKKELDWLERLSDLNIGPQLLGIFGNGRFEEYLPSITLTSQDLRNSNISTEIASRLYQLHSIVKHYPPKLNEKLEVWLNIDKWFHALSNGTLSTLKEKRPELSNEIDLIFNLNKLNQEIQSCKSILNSNTSPIVFAHNDTQYGNILKVNNTNELVVIDFEYAGYNPRGYDIVNHFCEWMYDYHSDQPDKLSIENYPTLDQQKSFLKAYSKEEDVELLMKEVNQWKMACHLLWALWGIVQASQSEIDFNYYSYALQRIKAFRIELSQY